MKKQYFVKCYNNREFYELVTVEVTEETFYDCITSKGYGDISYYYSSSTLMLSAECGDYYLEDLEYIKVLA